MTQIHRFRDKVAIHLEHGPTHYYDIKEAAQIAKAINACKRDIIKNERFSDSQFKTVNIKES